MADDKLQIARRSILYPVLIAEQELSERKPHPTIIYPIPTCPIVYASLVCTNFPLLVV